MESKEMLCQRLDAILLWNVGALALAGGCQNRSESGSAQTAGFWVGQFQALATCQNQNWV